MDSWDDSWLGNVRWTRCPQLRIEVPLFHLAFVYVHSLPLFGSLGMVSHLDTFSVLKLGFSISLLLKRHLPMKPSRFSFSEPIGNYSILLLFFNQRFVDNGRKFVFLPEIGWSSAMISVSGANFLHFVRLAWGLKTSNVEVLAVADYLSINQSMRIWVCLIRVSQWLYHHPQFVLVICRNCAGTKVFLDRRDHHSCIDSVDTAG